MSVRWEGGGGGQTDRDRESKRRGQGVALTKAGRYECKRQELNTWVTAR